MQIEVMMIPIIPSTDILHNSKIENIITAVALHTEGCMKKERVAIIVRILWTGGVSRVAILQQQALRKLGIQSDLIFIRDAGSAYSLPEGTIVMNKRESDNRQSSKLFAAITKKFAGHRGNEATVDVDLLFSALPTLRNYDAFVFHDQWSALFGPLLRIMGIPYILILHEFFRPPPTSKKLSVLSLFAWVYDVFSILMAPSVMTTSQYNYELARRLKAGVFLNRIGAPTPISPEDLDQKFNNTRKQVLSLSLWDKGRKPEFYASLASILPDIDFTLAGSWTVDEEYRKFKEEHRSIRNLVVTGRISEEQRELLFQGADFYIRIGYNERGPGMGGLEAMSKGLIPITNKSLGLSEILADGVNGFILEEPLLETAINVLTMLSDMSREELIEIAKNTLKLCAENSWEQNAKSIVTAFKNIGMRLQ